MNDCLFCKIINNDLPSEKIYEDDNTLVILDIRPVKPGHALVMPKIHVPTLLDAPQEFLTPLLPTVQKVGRALMKSLGADGFNISVNNGRAAGQIIDHLHVHVIPRHKSDGLKLWAQSEYAEGEMQKIGKKIRAALE